MLNVTSKLANQEHEIVYNGETYTYQIVPQFSSTLRKQWIMCTANSFVSYNDLCSLFELLSVSPEN